MMDAEYSEPNGKYESSTYVTVFGDIDLIQVQHMFYDSDCMWMSTVTVLSRALDTSKIPWT